jgi:1-deoxy-D-xylulose-5-phosphate reductoisomerase
MKRLILLGSTGSIGDSTLKVVRALPDCFQVVGLAAGSDWKKLIQQAAEFGVRDVAVADGDSAAECGRHAPAGMNLRAGAGGIEALVRETEADCVVCAVVGLAGLRPVLAALQRGLDVALATKEVLVAAGPIVMDLSRRTGGRLLPVDSEHNAVFQCLAGAGIPPGAKADAQVRRIVLTASGGPFSSRREIDFDRVTVKEALAHPRWNMGRKVTIDSATLMNKGLEIMEAHWLFGVPLAKIEVLIHPESIVHSMVEFVDGSLLAQLSPPDMRFAIQYALTWPERRDGGLPSLDFTKIRLLHFEEPDMTRFPCLRLAREAATTGGSLPCVLNAANEVAVDQFLEGRIPFSGIARTVEQVMDAHEVIRAPDLEGLVAADAWARGQALLAMAQPV